MERLDDLQVGEKKRKREIQKDRVLRGERARRRRIT